MESVRSIRARARASQALQKKVYLRTLYNSIVYNSIVQL